MDVRITVETTFDNGEKRTHPLDTISRPYRVTCPERFGLRLNHGKKIVGQIQKAILLDQVEEIIRESRVCPTCSRIRAIHDYRRRVLDTLFGRVRVNAARLRRCFCDATQPKHSLFRWLCTSLQPMPQSMVHSHARAADWRSVGPKLATVSSSNGMKPV